MFGWAQAVMMSGAWPPPAPFGMEGVDGAPADGGEGVFHKTGFIQGVAVQGDWMSISSATVNAQSIAAGVAPQSSWIFQANNARRHLLAQGIRLRNVALAQQADIDRQAVGRLQHA